jgi:hypothetical protein
MAFELQVPTVIDVCIDCVYFNAYDRLDDTTMTADPQAAEKHRARIAASGWSYGTEFTSGCGSNCPDIDSDGTGGCCNYQDWSGTGELEPDDNADPGPWFSWNPCEQCGSTLGGDREHATAWEYAR